MDSMAIKQQLLKLHNTRQFCASERLLSLLSYIVHKTLNDEQKDLNQRQIAEDVFNKSASFDPERDSIVRVEMGKLRKALHQYYLEFGVNDSICIKIPNRTYIPSFIEQNNFSNLIKNEEPKILILPIETLEQNFNERRISRYLSDELVLAFSNTKGVRVTAPSYWDDVVNQREMGDSPFVLEGVYYSNGENSILNIRIQDTLQNEVTWANSYRMNDDDLLTTLSALALRIVSDSFDPYVGKIIHKLPSHEVFAPTGAFQARKAKLKYFKYLANINDENYFIARQHLDEAIKSATNDHELLCMHADMTRAGYAQGYLNEKNPIDEILKNISQFVNIIPDCLSCKIAYCYALLQGNKKQTLFQLVDDILSTPYLPPTFGAEAAITLMLGGQWDNGRVILEKMLSQITQPPDFFIYPLILDAYRNRDFEQAHIMCCKLTSNNDCFWHRMLLTASLAQIGLLDEANRMGSKLIQSRPNVDKHIHRILTCFILDEPLIKLLEEGLSMAGIAIPNQLSERGIQN